MDHFHYLRRQTHARVARSCSGEMEREVHGILGPVGVDESLSRLVAESLREVEEDMCRDVGEGEEWDTAANGDQGVVRPGVGAGVSAGKRSDARNGFLAQFGWSQTKAGSEEEAGGLKWSEDVGLTAFLLKFGEGMGTLDGLGCFTRWLTVRRGSAALTTLHLCVHDRSLVLYRRSRTAGTLLFRRDRYDRSDRVVDPDGYDPADLWSVQDVLYRRDRWCRRLRVGSDQYDARRWSRCGRCVWDRQGARSARIDSNHVTSMNRHVLSQ
jgi:hypothetical protein